MDCYLDHINGLNDTGSKHTRNTTINKGLHSWPGSSWFWFLLSHYFFFFSLSSFPSNGERGEWTKRGFVSVKMENMDLLLSGKIKWAKIYYSPYNGTLKWICQQKFHSPDSIHSNSGRLVFYFCNLSHIY